MAIVTIEFNEKTGHLFYNRRNDNSFTNGYVTIDKLNDSKADEFGMWLDNNYLRLAKSLNIKIKDEEFGYEFTYNQIYKIYQNWLKLSTT